MKKKYTKTFRKKYGIKLWPHFGRISQDINSNHRKQRSVRVTVLKFETYVSKYIIEIKRQYRLREDISKTYDCQRTNTWRTSQTNEKNSNKLTGKWVKGINRLFREDKIGMGNKHPKTWLILLMIRKMQIWTTGKYHFIPIILEKMLKVWQYWALGCEAIDSYLEWIMWKLIKTWHWRPAGEAFLPINPRKSQIPSEETDTILFQLLHHPAVRRLLPSTSHL